MYASWIQISAARTGIVMETKADRRERKRRKRMYAPVGVPWTKVRTTTSQEVRARLRKRRKVKGG
jgi:hypothetical protein